VVFSKIDLSPPQYIRFTESIVTFFDHSRRELDEFYPIGRSKITILSKSRKNYWIFVYLV